jgi:hypothetical protein
MGREYSLAASLGLRPATADDRACPSKVFFVAVESESTDAL